MSWGFITLGDVDICNWEELLTGTMCNPNHDWSGSMYLRPVSFSSCLLRDKKNWLILQWALLGSITRAGYTGTRKMWDRLSHQLPDSNFWANIENMGTMKRRERNVLGSNGSADQLHVHVLISISCFNHVQRPCMSTTQLSVSRLVFTVKDGLKEELREIKARVCILAVQNDYLFLQAYFKS